MLGHTLVLDLNIRGQHFLPILKSQLRDFNMQSDFKVLKTINDRLISFGIIDKPEYQVQKSMKVKSGRGNSKFGLRADHPPHANAMIYANFYLHYH